MSQQFNFRLESSLIFDGEVSCLEQPVPFHYFLFLQWPYVTEEPENINALSTFYGLAYIKIPDTNVHSMLCFLFLFLAQVCNRFNVLV